MYNVSPWLPCYMPRTSLRAAACIFDHLQWLMQSVTSASKQAYVRGRGGAWLLNCNNILQVLVNKQSFYLNIAPSVFTF